MQLAVRFVHNRKAIAVQINGVYRDASGATVAAGTYTFDKPIALTPASDDASFTVPDVTIGIGFHWERNERQSFRGGLRIIPTAGGLTAIKYMAEIVPRDGTYLTMAGQALSLDQALGFTPTFKADLRSFHWIGNISDSNLLSYTWHTSPTKTMQDAKAGLNR